ncbi:hypothetical protein HPP92_012694 [Vanilla planifolia]|uniref:Uncharacterized protein n=1 Tax=Vanilla planifolia TaxID=51239 RepID=A0A835UVX3_VANPL|nr:hypothetical protein HPP92_012694 [Vanilla planifolia]
MYMAYGWPQVIPVNTGERHSGGVFVDRIIYLKIINRLLLVVTPTHLQLWSCSQHKLLLGKFARDADSVRREGENLQAIWSPDTKNIAVLTSSAFFHIYKIQFSGKRLLIGSKQICGLFLANISLVISEKAPFLEDWTTSNLVCDNKSVLFGLSNGYLQAVTWNAEFSVTFEVCSSTYTTDSLDVSFPSMLNVSTDDAMCASIASEQQILAVGCSRGVVELYDLTDNAPPFRTISLYDWGYSMEDTGPVSCITWTPDNYAFAVGWKFRDLLYELKIEPLLCGTSLLQWDEYGYKLYAVEESSSDKILAFSFGKCCLNRGLLSTTYVRQILYGEDRVLIVHSDDTDELKISHIKLPVSYISQNWPVQHVVASKDGMYLAIAGLHGVVLYDLRSKRWRFFGDVSQEQKIECKGLLWMGKIIILCNFVDSSNTYELLFYPRYHLDQSSLLYRKPLLGKPIIMDVFQDYLLITYHPFDVHIFQVKIFGELSPTSSPNLQVIWKFLSVSVFLNGRNLLCSQNCYFIFFLKVRK